MGLLKLNARRDVAMQTTLFEASVLGRPGHPDCALKQGERATYLEIKTSASIQKEADRYLKTFSFSSGKKTKPDARHLLLRVQLEEEDNKIWKAVAWELRDLPTLKTSLTSGCGGRPTTLHSRRPWAGNRPLTSRWRRPRVRDKGGDRHPVAHSSSVDGAWALSRGDAD
jgi:hypothetical protein